MKVLVIQENGRHEANRHMRECFSIQKAFKRAGIDASVWGLGHDSYNVPFYEIVDSHDVIMTLENYDTGWMPDLSSLNKLKIFWSIDSHCALHSHRHFCHAAKIDILLNSTSHYIKFFEGLARKLVWFPNAIDSDLFKPRLDVLKQHDVGFCGSIIADRAQWISTISNYLPVRAATRVLGDDMLNEISSYRVGLNKSIDIDIPYRVFEMTACGIPLVTNNVPDLDKLFSIGEDLLVYNNIEELVKNVRYLLDNETKRYDIALKGLQRTKQLHTYDERIKQLLSII